MLSERYGDKLESILISRDDWHPYPTVGDRYGLDGVTGDLTMCLMTPSHVSVQGGVVTFSGLGLDEDRKSADGRVLFDAGLFEVKVEDYPLAGVSFKRGNPWGGEFDAGCVCSEGSEGRG